MSVPGENGVRRENGKSSRPPPLEVQLLGDDGQPTEFLRNAPFLDYGSPMTALERCVASCLDGTHHHGAILQAQRNPIAQHIDTCEWSVP